MSKTLLIRNVPEEIHSQLLDVAARNHRSAEAHVRFLIETDVCADKAETCGDLSDRIWNSPAPEINVEDIETYLDGRGRRSNRT